MDKIDKLYNLYKSKGLITDATPIDKFRSATEEQKVKLYNLGKSKNLFKTTDINTFSSAWGEPTPIKKKRGIGFTIGSRRYFIGLTRNADSRAFGIFSVPKRR